MNALESKNDTFEDNTFHTNSGVKENPKDEYRNTGNQRNKDNNLKDTAKNKFNIKDFLPVPSKIHMIWVASEPGENQMKYIKSWAKKILTQKSTFGVILDFLNYIEIILRLRKLHCWIAISLLKRKKFFSGKNPP